MQRLWAILIDTKANWRPWNNIVGLLTCFSIDPWKPHSKIPKTHLSTPFWCWHSRNFQKWKFLFLSIFFEILFKNNFPFYGTVSFLIFQKVTSRIKSSDHLILIRYKILNLYQEILAEFTINFCETVRNFRQDCKRISWE